ncbi:hypothetical protein NLI96_g3406 [Meripilus lineatus]|uniref:Transmembrane protein n=1 Tax=Meripilus lineatus TaxID=2056292 RepID=A0AAD5V6X4_9APHY|nr:hypothetical protein NLI96_g3406 [Physisporinus lineatus]
MAKDWMSPEEIALDASIFLKLMHAIAGMYIWEFCISLNFEWSFFNGKKKFNWPMIFYFLGRYWALFTLVGLLVALDSTTFIREVNCQALYTFLAVAGQVTIGFASINLAIRAMVIWGQSIYIVVPLVILILGHWAVLMQGVVVTASWTGSACAVSQTNSSVLTATFAYSICLDFIVFAVTAWKLVMPNRRRSQLMDLMFKDGLVYFVLAFVANVPAAVVISLKLNPVMDIMFNIPAAITSTTVACRAVRRLANFSATTPAIYMTTEHRDGPHSAIMFRSGGHTDVNTAVSLASGKPAEGVHVQVKLLCRISDILGGAC